MKNLLNQAYLNLMCRLNAMKEEEVGASDMIAVVILIGIVVLVALVFKEEIGNLVENIFATTAEKATKAMQEY